MISFAPARRAVAAVATAAAFVAPASAAPIYSNVGTNPFLAEPLVGEAFKSAGNVAAGQSLDIVFDVEAINGAQAQVTAALVSLDAFSSLAHFYGTDFDTLLSLATLESAPTNVRTGSVRLTATPGAANDAILQDQWMILAMKVVAPDNTQLIFSTSGSHPEHFLVGGSSLAGFDLEDHSQNLAAVVGASNNVPEPAAPALVLAAGLAAFAATRASAKRKAALPAARM